MNKRRPILVCSLIIGTLAFLGSGLFAVAGAGILGSPFSGGSYHQITLLLLLICGPVIVLPCTLFDLRKPGYGGFVLCSLALVEVGMISLHHVMEYGFNIFNAAGASLFIALPMFVIGSLLLFSGKPHAAWLNRAWWIELFLAASVSVWFLWQLVKLTLINFGVL